MKKVLFLPLYDSHIRVFMPLIKHMEKQKQLEPLVVLFDRVHADTSADLLKENNVSYVKASLVPVSFRRGLKLQISELTMKSMEKNLLTLFYTKRKVKELFDSLNPALIITVNESYYADRFFLQEAKKRDIPSLSLFSVILQTPISTSPVQTGISLKRLASYAAGWLLAKVLSLYRSILITLGIPLFYIGSPSRGQATLVCVWNKAVKRKLVESGGLAEKIVVTGSPGHDMLYHKDIYFNQEATNRIYNSLNIERDKEIILFLSQPFASGGYCTVAEQRRLTESVIESAAQSGESILVIKLHPRESINEYAYLEGHPAKDRFRVVSSGDVELYSIMQASRLIITQSSTAGLDAVLLGKDIINVNLIIKAQPDYVKRGTTLAVYTESELAPAIQRILNDEATRVNLRKAREKFIKNNFPTFDGKATERIMELISQMLVECAG